jgi:hypothetical protein
MKHIDHKKVTASNKKKIHNFYGKYIKNQSGGNNNSKSRHNSLIKIKAEFEYNHKTQASGG